MDIPHEARLHHGEGAVMMIVKLFPIILMSLDILASLVYFCKGDWKLGFGSP